MDFNEVRLMEIDDFTSAAGSRHLWPTRHDLEDAAADARNLGERRETWFACSVDCSGAAASSGWPAPGSSSREISSGQPLSWPFVVGREKAGLEFQRLGAIPITSKSSSGLPDWGHRRRCRRCRLWLGAVSGPVRILSHAPLPGRWPANRSPSADPMEKRAPVCG
jgi:hypothetical protein